jgi:hypothetical protein
MIRSSPFWPAAILVATMVMAACGGQTTTTPAARTTTSPSAQTTETRVERSPSPPAPSVDSGCPAHDEEPEGLPASYRPVGDSLEGDLRGDGRSTRALILGDEERPLRCRYFLVVGYPEGAASYAPIEAAKSLPYDVPSLLMAVEIDGQSGLEVVVDFGGPMHPHRTGQVFTFEGAALVATRFEPAQLDGIPPILFPLGGEFAAGVDCAGEPGAIVVTLGDLAEGGTDDRHFEVTRTFYRAEGGRFVETRRETHTIEVGTEGERWPELADDPFRSCSGAK